MDFIEYGIKVDANGSDQQRVICPVCSKTRIKSTEPCLSVNLKDGIWFCQHCGWKGSIKEKINHKLTFKNLNKKLEPPSDNIYEWFRGRHISRTTVDKLKITQGNEYFPEPKKVKPCINFNYYLGEQLINIKSRSRDKEFALVKNAPLIFYNLNSVAMAKKCCITEGELDCASYIEIGINEVISVPNGANVRKEGNNDASLKYLDNSFEYIAHIERFYISTDDDEPGRALKEELCRRLGKSKCYIVCYPPDCKDANEVLMKHGVGKLKECYENAEPYPITGIYSPMSKDKEILDIYRYGYKKGAKTGSMRLFDNHISFYPGMLTVISGVPSHGKTNYISQVHIELARNANWRFGVFSPEDACTEITTHRYMEIYSGKGLLPNSRNRMSQKEFDDALTFVELHFRYVLPDNAEYTIDNILDSFKYLVSKYGIQGFVIDPWNTIEHLYGKDNETNYISKVLNKIKYFARANNTHAFVVAHPRKMMKKPNSEEYEVPNPYDISGSNNWYNIADNIITVYRHFKITDCNTSVYIQKVKHKFIGRVGKIDFNYDIDCQRYTEIDRVLNAAIKQDEEKDDIPF